MSGQNNGGIREYENFFAYTALEQFPIAAREIPSTHSAMKKNVAADQHAVPGRIKAEAARTVPRHFEHIERPSEKILLWTLAEDFVDLHRKRAERKPLTDEKILVTDHRHRVLVADHAATVTGTHRRRIRDVVPMSVRQHKQPDTLARERFISTLRRIEKNEAARRLRGKAVGLVGSASESFELHRLLEVEARDLIFLAQHGNQGNQL